MFEVPCPKCRCMLAFEQQDARRKTKCPRCRHKFTVPPAPPPATGAWTTLAFVCLGIALLALIAVAWTIGIGWTLVLLVCLAAIFVSSPPGGRLLSNASRRAGRHGKLKATRTAEAAPTVLNFVHQNVPVEIQSATGTPSAALQRIGFPSAPLESTRKTPNADIRFLGPGSLLELDRGSLRDPLIYVVQGTLPEPAEPSTLELGLPIGRAGIVPGQEPLNWPAYRALNPSQRAFYLEWLTGGRRQSVPLPYVMLYVYGLERRVLVDAQDHNAVAVELIGLLQAYHTHYPFRRDIVHLLWLTIELSSEFIPVERSTADAAIQHTQEWTEPLLRHCLAAFASRQWAIPAILAQRIAAEYPRTVNSVAITRHPDMFRTLFQQRFATEFPDGCIPQTAGRAERIDYVTINPSLARLPRSETNLNARVRVPTTSPHIDKLVEIWERGVADLKVYDRVQRSAEAGPLTADMWEALPEISRQDTEHPEADAWHALLLHAFQQHTRPLVAIADLAQIKQFEQRGRLTKKQSEQLVATATHLHLAIEPDARLTGKAYAWDDLVAIFPRRDDTAEDLAAYQAASVLLRLGMNVAAADGEIDQTELARITSQLETQFELTPTAADRLEHLKYALIHSPAARGQVEKSLQEKLRPEQRQIVGEFLVGIAIADGTISPAELKALKKAWQALGLPASSLEDLLQQPTPAPAGQAQSLVLDQARISQIMLDTQRVAEMLRAAMSIDEETDETPEHEPESSPGAVAAPVASGIPPTVVTSPASTPNRAPAENIVAQNSVVANTVAANTAGSNPDWSDLPSRYHAFLGEVLTRPVWPRNELDRLARGSQLMLGGALEAINEWTHELHGDWLISEEGDEIHVQQSLLSSHR